MVLRIPLSVAACSVSLAAGLTQLVFAWWGNVLWDARTMARDRVEIPLFGYFATFYWWVPYVTVVPVMLGCSIHGLVTMWRLSDGSRWCRRGLVAAISISVLLATFFVGREIIRSLTVEPMEWAQWNELRAEPFGAFWRRPWRWALYLVGYAHYFVAYVLSVACVLGAFAVAATLRVPSLRTERDSVRRGLSNILLAAKIVVAGYLFYLVLLRSSKVSMWLTSRGEVPTLDKVYEFFENAQPYFEASREGVLLNIGLGLLWSLICVMTHVLSVSSTRGPDPISWTG